MDIQMLIGNINANKDLNSNSSSEPKNTTEKVSSFSKELTKVAEKQNTTDDKTAEEEFDSKVYQLVLSFLNGSIDLNTLKDQLKTIEVPKNINFSVDKLIGSVNELKNNLSNIIKDLELVKNSDNLNNFNLKDVKTQENVVAINQNSVKTDDKVILSIINTNSEEGNDVTKKILTGIVKSLVKESTTMVENEEIKIQNILHNVPEVSLSIANRGIFSTKNEKTNGAKELKNGDDFLTKLLSNVDGNNDKKEPQVSRVINIMDNLKNDFKVNVDSLNELPMINKSTFVSDMIKNVRFMSINSMKELTVKIMPKELGEVVIKLVMDGNMLKANIQASNKEAYNLLNSQLSDLTKGLNEVKIQSVNISIYQEDTTFFAGQFKDNSRQQQEENKKKSSGTSSLRIEEVSTDASSNYNGNVNILA